MWLIASFSFLIFNDVLVSSTLTLPVNIFTLEKEKPCSPGAVKISMPPGEHGFSFFQVKMFTGSVSVLLTGTSLKKNKNLKKNYCWYQVVSGGSLF